MKCTDKYFYDTVTDNCAPCRDLCLNAAMQDTEKDCQLKCPDWVDDKPPDPVGSGQDVVQWIAIVLLGVVIFVIVVVLWIYRRKLCQWLTNKCAQHRDEAPDDAGIALNVMQRNDDENELYNDENELYNDRHGMGLTARNTVLGQAQSGLNTNCEVVPSGH